VQQVLFLLLAGLLVITVLNQANPARKTPSRDHGIYIYVGAQILKGHLPYETAWESKPPGVFYVGALGLWLGRGSRWGVWVVEALSLLAAIILSFGLMRRLWGTWAALFGLLTWLYGLNWSLMGGNLTEEYPLPLHFLALWLFPALLRPDPNRLLALLLGAVFSLTFLFRANNAVTEAAVILTILLARLARRDLRGLLRQGFWIALGAALPLALTVVWFQAHGLLRELLEASLLYNLVYGGTPFTAASPIVTGAALLGGALWIAAAGYVLAALHLWAGGEDRWWYVLLLIGWPLVIFLSDLARRNYAHYYMNWLPFMALLAALAFHSVQRLLLPRLDESSPLRVAGLITALGLALAFFLSQGMWEDQGKVIRRLREGAPAWGEVRSPVAVYVNEHTRPGEKVIFWGGYPGENFMSRRDSPVAALLYPLYLRSGIADRLERHFFEELQAGPPVMIVDMGEPWAFSLDPLERERLRLAGEGWPYPPANLEEVFAFIDANYFLERRFRGLGIYRLKGTVSIVP